MLGLRFCARTFSSCGKRGPLFIAVHGPLTVAASRVAGHRLQTCRLSNCGSRAQLLRGMWDPPRPGLEPVSPALAGRFSITAPPGKPPAFHFLKSLISLWKKLPVRADLSLHLDKQGKGWSGSSFYRGNSELKLPKQVFPPSVDSSPTSLVWNLTVKFKHSLAFV